MLTSNLVHPQIMAALSRCGHGSKILIADGNNPLAEKTGGAEKVYLGLTRGHFLSGPAEKAGGRSCGIRTGSR